MLCGSPRGSIRRGRGMASGFSVSLQKEFGETSCGLRLRLPGRLVLLRTLLPPTLTGIFLILARGGEDSDVDHTTQ